jgi:cob(I)alamin adenosyltransferase
MDGHGVANDLAVVSFVGRFDELISFVMVAKNHNAC